MNVKNINKALSNFEENLAGGLMACDVFSASDGQSIAGINSNPKACALFSNITNYLRKALEGSKFPPIKDYYLINLEGNKAVLVGLITDTFLFGCLVDTDKAKVGLLTNIAFPQLKSELLEAIG